MPHYSETAFSRGIGAVSLSLHYHFCRHLPGDLCSHSQSAIQTSPVNQTVHAECETASRKETTIRGCEIPTRIY